MPIKYKTQWPSLAIVPVEIDREGTTLVWIEGVAQQKQSAWHCYSNTWEEAHQHLLSMARAKSRTTGVAHERAKMVLDVVESMTFLRPVASAPS